MAAYSGEQVLTMLDDWDNSDDDDGLSDLEDYTYTDPLDSAQGTSLSPFHSPPHLTPSHSATPPATPPPATCSSATPPPATPPPATPPPC